MPQVHYDSYTEARNNLKNLLDAAESGQVATVRRDSATAVVLDAERLRYSSCPWCHPKPRSFRRLADGQYSSPACPSPQMGGLSRRPSPRWPVRCASTLRTGKTTSCMHPTIARTGAWYS